jgi:hypothetical protein
MLSSIKDNDSLGYYLISLFHRKPIDYSANSAFAGPAGLIHISQTAI